MRKFVFLLISLIALSASAQNITISGYVTDIQSGETVINASILDFNTKKGGVTNVYGYYSVTLPKGNFDFQYSYVGYEAQRLRFTALKDTVINIKLNPASTLQEVTVVGQRKITGVESTQMSAIEVPISQIKSVPTLFGEADLIKALQLLPGVKAGAEGFTGMYVRGGGPDENLFLLDGIPLYNVNHLAGFFSVFNPDAIKNVTLYKGNFPARFGGRLSSVIDVRMNDGNEKKIHGNVSIGLISSKINVEGPLFSKNTTFNVSYRRTYADIILQPVFWYASTQNNGGLDMNNFSAGYYFYDFNAKINHKISDNDRLIASVYTGDDAVSARVRNGYGDTDKQYFENYMKLGMNWGNVLTALRWNHLISNKLFMNSTLSYTRYRYNMGVGTDMKQIDKTLSPPKTSSQNIYLGFNSGIEDFAGKVDFDYAPHPNHDVKFGLNYTNHTFRPGVTLMNYSVKLDTAQMSIDTTIGNNNVYSNEVMLYAEDNIDLGHAFKLNLGAHYSAFYVQNKFYNSLQPRASLRVLLNDKLSLKAGYAAMTQYIHLLSTSNITLPTDLWVPVTKRIEPMRSHQVSAGLFYNLNNIVDLSLETYYKSMTNLIEYKDGASFMGTSTGWEDKVSMGRGWAYGVEFLAQKTVGKTTGWIGYTWSKTDRLFDRPGEELNFGKVFPAKYDRRHDFSLVVSHKFSDRFDMAGTWVYSTGNAATLSTQSIVGATYDNTISYNNMIPYVSGRNNFRMPDYHRMDLAFNFHKKLKNGMQTWNISFYNAYNNNNPFMVYPKTDYVPIYDNSGTIVRYDEKRSLVQLSIFPIIPSVSYSYKW